MGTAADNRLFHSTILLIACHIFGVIGLLSPFREYFLLATPFNLILSTFLILWNHHDRNRSFYVFCGIGSLFGYFIEVAGVKTGLVFGEYSYGASLGLKLFDVPLVMGINWLMLVYSVGVILEATRLHYLLKSLIGAAMLVLLDLFIEPVAIRFDFWTWTSGSIPVQNYVAWFLASFLLLLLFYGLDFRKENRLAKALYLVQLVFFILLNIF